MVPVSSNDHVVLRGYHRPATSLLHVFLRKGTKSVEIHLTPDAQAKLEQMARDSGRRSEDLVEDAVIGLFDELTRTRAILDRRYDDLESGQVQPIDGEEAFHRLMTKTEERLRHRPA
jgi:hypothetical protein